MSKRPVKLTSDELDEMRDMSISTTVGNRPALVHLAELGLCRHWKGKYGWIACLTHEGRDYMAMVSPGGATPTAPLPAKEQRVVVHPETPPSPPSSQPAKKRRVDVKQPPAPPKPASGAAKAAGTNHRKACRVLIGARYHYYPVSAFESLSYADKQIVETIHPFYSSRTVEASAGDHPVLPGPAPRVRSKRPRNRKDA